MRKMGKMGLVVAVCLALSIATVLPAVAAQHKTKSEMLAEANASITSITVEQAYQDHYQANKPDVIFLDVRGADEVEAGHIPGATWIPRGFLEFRIESTFPDPGAQTLIVYCKSGGRSSLATETLQIMGYNAINMEGGFSAWQASRYPVRRGEISTSGGGCG